MPLAPVDDHGTVLHYEDTGAPPGSGTYTTIILVHGVQFNSGVFGRMVPFAAVNQLRLVLVNFREHGQSTPFTDEELKPLLSGDKESQATFMRLRVLEWAAFMVWYIQQEQIPHFEDTDGERTGGVSLVTWSGGNALGVTFFGFADIIPRQQRELIDRYLRSYILYDPAHNVLGAPMLPIDQLYNIILDPEVPAEQKADAWVPKIVGKYSQHGSYVAKSLTVPTLAELPALLPFLKQLQTTPDMLAWDPATLDSISDLFPVWRSFMPMVLLSSDVYAECVEKMLTRGYEPGQDSQKYFPRVKLEYIGCTDSLPECVYGTYWFKREVLQHEADGRKMRELNIRITEGASHAWHWIEPEKAIKLLAAVA